MPPEQEQLRCVLRSHLYRLLAEVRPEALPRCRRVRVSSGRLAAVLVIGPAAAVEREQPAAAQAGQWFSPLEAAIVLAIAGDTLQGKEIAARTNQPYSSDLKVLVRNLHARGVLEHVPGQGYRRADAAGRPA